MIGKASEIKTYFVQETTDKNLGQVINELFEGNLKDATIIDIKYVSANNEDGYGWHSALIIYKEVTQ
ncbi:hypothetical protein PMSD_25995 [Paenibacillus macquariensis subsp. defensor]|nr:hypothetical protein PMSD_25995 [Paenibacillus macquariensis subsp. defensor]